MNEASRSGSWSLLVANVGPTQFRFLIFPAPSPSSLGPCLRELDRHGVKHVVRVCAPTYKKEVLEAQGISVHEGEGWFFEDGAAPPKEVLANWFSLLEDVFGLKPTDGGHKEKKPDLAPQGFVQNATSSKDGPCIGVHCIAGLGRAPILVAIALIEFARVSAAEAVTRIRTVRPGCLNDEQLKWLLKYRPTRKEKDSGCCTVQ